MIENKKTNVHSFQYNTQIMCEISQSNANIMQIEHIVFLMRNRIFNVLNMIDPRSAFAIPMHVIQLNFFVIYGLQLTMLYVYVISMSIEINHRYIVYISTDSIYVSHIHSISNPTKAD